MYIIHQILQIVEKGLKKINKNSFQFFNKKIVRFFPKR